MVEGTRTRSIHAPAGLMKRIAATPSSGRGGANGWDVCPSGPCRPGARFLPPARGFPIPRATAPSVGRCTSCVVCPLVPSPSSLLPKHRPRFQDTTRFLVHHTSRLPSASGLLFNLPLPSLSALVPLPPLPVLRILAALARPPGFASMPLVRALDGAERMAAARCVALVLRLQLCGDGSSRTRS